jgi:hypothetical protein
VFGKRSGEKFVPDAYRVGSRETRLAILAGLLDTDGHLGASGCFEFSSHSRQLAGQVAFIARSLGLMANLREKEVNGELYWRVLLSGFIEKIPTRVLRKQAAPRRQKKNVLRTGFTAHPIGWGQYYGFTVDGDHRYLMGDFTVTHNSGKTIMLSAVAGQMINDGDAKACVLAHRDELTEQNCRPYVPSLEEATHPRCGCEGCPDRPGRASSKEGESWAILSKLLWLLIHPSCVMRLRLRTPVGRVRFGFWARSRTPRRRSQSL